mgnify:CR=1 FL=1
MIPEEVNKELKLPDTKLRLGPFSTSIIEETIKEAISFSSGERNLKQKTTLYHFDNIEIVAEKPGKEFFEDNIRHKDGSLGNNSNDMTPAIYIDNKRVDENLTFSDIFRIFEGFINDRNLDNLEVLGSVMFRQAFMLDHKKTDGNWRLNIPNASIKYLEESKPNIEGIPIKAFLYLLEVLALNESVKYFTLGHAIKSGVGRRNNLLTCCHLIAVLLQKTSLWKFAGSLSRPPSGVAPLAQKNGREFFSPLA